MLKYPILNNIIKNIIDFKLTDSNFPSNRKKNLIIVILLNSLKSRRTILNSDIFQILNFTIKKRLLYYFI